MIYAFVGEENFFEREAAGEAAEAGAREDAVAGDEEGEGVGAKGVADGTGGTGTASCCGEGAIGSGLTKRYL